MWKLLLIIILVGFLLSKVFGFFFRVLLGNSAADRANGKAHQNQQYQNNSRKSADGNVNIDYVPKNGEAKEAPKAFKGGEYVDYEEVD